MSQARAAIQTAFDHFRAGRTDAARQTMLRALQRWPRDIELLVNFVDLLLNLNEGEPAALWAERLTAAAPNVAEAWSVRAHAAIARSKLDEAIAYATRAVELEPQSADRHRSLAWVLHRALRFPAAAESARRGLELAPADADLWQKLAVAHQALGRTDEAEAIYRQGVARCPGSVALAEGLAYCANQLAHVTPAQVRADHDHFARVLRAANPAGSPPPARAIAPDQPVRVGLLSPDLRHHSVGMFIASLLRHHDPRELALFVYSTAAREDAFSQKLAACLPADRWRRVFPPEPEALDRTIRADGLDLLVELSGLTRDNNLAALLRRPAPRLATYLGYPNTTGLSEIDARLVDAFTDPPGAEYDAACAERLVRLEPCFVAYSPPEPMPAIDWSPCEKPGDRPLVFGCFNNLMKLNGALLARWAALLAAVPESRLMLKAFGLGDEPVREDLRARCLQAGLPGERLDLLPPDADPGDHLRAYNRIDVALDTYPYHGTTTTCEALVMGVPVVTIEGDRHAARVGVSLMRNAGLQELITQSPESMIEVCADLIRDQPRLARYRRELRPRFLASPVCDGPAYARAFARAVRQIVAAER
jgi:predicted O-linked N-acetylglucosamine transferase (SPINDLY family)